MFLIGCLKDGAVQKPVTVEPHQAPVQQIIFDVESELRLFVRPNEVYELTFPSKIEKGEWGPSTKGVILTRVDNKLTIRIEEHLPFDTILLRVYIDRDIGFVSLHNAQPALNLHSRNLSATELDSIALEIRNLCRKKMKNYCRGNCIDGFGIRHFVDMRRPECSAEQAAKRGPADKCIVARAWSSICTPCDRGFWIEGTGMVICEDFLKQLWQLQHDCSGCIKETDSYPEPLSTFSLDNEK